MNTYIDVLDFLRGTHGLETASLIGNVARFTTAQTAGATSLTVPAAGPNSITVPLALFDHVTIFDGANTEVVQVGAAGAAIGATSIPLLAGTSLQFNHAIGVSWCSDGIAGSLADQIVSASSWIETQCNQPLLSATWTNELLYMPSMRASIDNQNALHFRPRHWPVTALTALSISSTPQVVISYDTTQAFIDSDKQVCFITNLAATSTGGGGQGQAPYPFRQSFGRMAQAQLSITYTSGYAYSALPGDLKEAAILVTSEFVAKRHNPVGAPDIADGSTHLSAIIRGEKSGESLLVTRARNILIKYSTQPF